MYWAVHDCLSSLVAMGPPLFHGPDDEHTAEKFMADWIASIHSITPSARHNRGGVAAGQPAQAMIFWPWWRAAGGGESLRRYASEGWIIDVTPERRTLDIPTRIFPNVWQPFASGLFLRTSDVSDQVPATIHDRSASGRQADKFAGLQVLLLATRVDAPSLQ